MTINLDKLNAKKLEGDQTGIDAIGTESPDLTMKKKIYSNVTFNACGIDKLNKLDSIYPKRKVDQKNLKNSSVKSRSLSPPRKNQVSLLNYNLKLKFSDNTSSTKYEKHLSEID